MLKLVFGSMNEFDSILKSHLLQSKICLFFIDSPLNILYQSNNSGTLCNSLWENIYHFGHHSSSILKAIDSCNESLIRTTIRSNHLHSLKALSKQMNNLEISCMMKNAILNFSILVKVSSFDVILFITNKFHQMISSLTKMSLFSTSIMLYLIFHQWICFFMILIKLTQQVN